MTTYNGVPLDRAGIVSTVMEGLLYGQLVESFV